MYLLENQCWFVARPEIPKNNLSVYADAAKHVTAVWLKYKIFNTFSVCLELDVSFEETMFALLRLWLMQVVCNVFLHPILSFVWLWFLCMSWTLTHFFVAVLAACHSHLIHVIDLELTFEVLVIWLFLIGFCLVAQVVDVFRRFQ